MTIHVGLVGGGGITETHAKAVLAVPGTAITAVHGTNDARVRRLCDRVGGTAYADFDAFTSHRPMDVAVIGSPSGLHAPQGIALARAGVHVLIEKPIDVTTERGDALVSAARAAGVTLGVIYQDRFKPDILELKRALTDGRIGRPILAHAEVPWYRPTEYYSRSRWRAAWPLAGGGALMMQAIHTVDLLLWLLGDVSRVQARTATQLHDVDVEDCGAAILEFASGVLGTLTFSTATYPGYPRRLVVTGESGTGVIENDELVALDLRDGTRLRPKAAAVAEGDERAASPVVDDTRGHQAVFEDFLEAIRDGRPPRCDGRDALRSVALVESIYEASRLSQTTPVIARAARRHGGGNDAAS